LDRFHALTVQGLHALSAGWRAHLPSRVELLPDLPPVESLVIRDAQCFHQNITVEGLQTLHPYLPVEGAQRALQTLVEKKILESASRNAFRYSATTLAQIQETERAILTCAARVVTLGQEQADHLAVLTTALVDMISNGPNPVATPIFTLVNGGLASSEHSQGQIQQRLISLLAYRDDAHVGAWRAEGYSAPAIRVATLLFRQDGTIPRARLQEWPLLYDERYLKTGLDELLKTANVETTDEGYRLTVTGSARREKVESLTDEYFRAPFEQRMSENGRRQWMTLMTLLAEGGKLRPGSAPPTVNLPVPVGGEATPASGLPEGSSST
jgi:hypothetical protein